MWVTYQPVAGALPVPPWSTAFLSQRDLSLRIPLNFVTFPGVSLSAACFADGIYETEAGALCLSNLLATGFRRIIVDVYWDSGRRAWSLCPVELPTNASTVNTSPASASYTSESSSVTLTAGQLTANSKRIALPSSHGDCNRNVDQNAVLFVRQTTSTSSSTTIASGTVENSATITVSSQGGTPPKVTSNATTVSFVSPSNGITLVRNGPYECSPSIDLASFVSVLNQYIQSTSNTLAAFVTIAEFNIHVAASITAPTSPAFALNTSTVPKSGELLRNTLAGNLSSVLYTPAKLLNDRADLNSSWFGVSSSLRPDSTFFNSTRNSSNIITTENGWPSASYLEFAKGYRLLAGFRSVDPQFALYNFEADGDTIFPAGFLANDDSIAYSSSGELDEGCFFRNGYTNIAATNNSWALTSDVQLPQVYVPANVTFIPKISNLTDCGVSPILNTTLSDTTADVDLERYKSFVYNSIWSWSFGEPRNVSSSEPNSDRMRCALLDSSLSGRWRVADCTERHFAACRANGEPYIWRTSSTRGTYSASEGSCPDGTTFAAPRSGLENSYLGAATDERRRDAGDTTFWVNLNSLDVEGCWVTGANATCPYTKGGSASTGRTVVVPVVAAIVVLVIAALTVFVKCAANRQDTKRGRRRRRADDGWDYEGVPS